MSRAENDADVCAGLRLMFTTRDYWLQSSGDRRRAQPQEPETSAESTEIQGIKLQLQRIDARLAEIIEILRQVSGRKPENMR
jgi:hypothetical protein